MRKLFKTTVTVELFISAEHAGEADKVAALYGGNEIPRYGVAKSVEVQDHKELPPDWANIIPYSNEPIEVETCSVLLTRLIEAQPKGQKIEEVTVAPAIPNKNIAKGHTSEKTVAHALETIIAKPIVPETTTTTETKPPKADGLGTGLPTLRF